MTQIPNVITKLKKQNTNKKNQNKFSNQDNICKYLTNSLLINLVFLFLDYFNIISKILEQDIKYDECCFLYMMFLVLIIINKEKFINLIKEKENSIIDECIKYSICTVVINIFFCLFMNHRLILNFITLIILAMLAGYRSIIKKAKDLPKKAYNLISLSDLKNNNLKIKKNELVLLREEPITSLEKDLLDIETTVNNLVKFYTTCHNEKSFVLGMVGEWGSGKSSIINLAKEQIKNNEEYSAKIEIINLSVWNYKNINSMLFDFYKALLKVVDEKSNKIELKNTLKKYLNIAINYLSNKTAISLNSLFDDEDNSFFELKEEINKLLSNIDKDIIVVLDDLDRLSKDQILTTLNVVNNIIDFSQMKIVICYDESRIEKTLENDNSYEKKYMDKIINSKLHIPSIDRKSFLKMVKDIIKNFLQLNEIDYDSDEISMIIEEISNDLLNVRDLIRFLNSLSINLNTFKKYKLYLPDFIALEYIKYSNEKLYQTIYNEISIFTKIGIDDRKEKEDIIDKCDITIYQKRLVLHYLFYENIRNEANKKRRCISPKYFYSYFGYKHTDYSKRVLEVENIIKEFNDNQSIENYLNNIIYKFDTIYEYKEIFENYSDMVNQKIEFIEELSKYSGTFSGIIRKILNEIDSQQAIQFINDRDYNNVDFLFRLHREYESHGYSSNEEDLKKLIDKRISKLITKAMEQNIDLYEKNVYAESILAILNQKLEKNETKIYLTSIINEKNVFKVLFDMMPIITSTNPKITFNRSENEEYIDLDKVDQIISNVALNKINKIEKHILVAYQNGVEEIERNEIIVLSNVRYKDFSKKVKK